MASETRNLRKRRWKSSPQKSAKIGLDFVPRTPSPKKRRIDVMDLGHNAESDSFTIKSFYGKKEKMHFPHSPGRRKAVDKVLQKLSDENTDSESNVNLTKARRKSQPGRIFSSRSGFEFRSSDSADSENDVPRRNVLRPKVVPGHKTPLNIRVKSKKKDAVKGREVKSAGKIPVKPSLEIDDPCKTPILSNKKFFKTRSPASADRVFGAIVVKKGFDLKFVPRKLKVSESKIVKNKKNSEAKQQVKSKSTKSVGKVNAKSVMSIDPDGIFCVAQKESGNSSKGCGKSQAAEAVDKDSRDSAIETANSTDFLTSSFDRMESLQHDGPDDSETFVDSVDTAEDAKSEDLFAESPMIRGSSSMSMTTLSACESPSSLADCSDDSSVVSGPEGEHTPKLFPIFTKRRSTEATPSPASSQSMKLRSKESPKNFPRLRYRKSKDNKEQMGIDAGQKRYGVSQCETCGMVYEVANLADEMMHNKLHQSLLNTLKFPGWKKERVVQKYLDTGCRILMVNTNDPKYATRKVEEINRIMGKELGFPEPSLAFKASFQAFLYVSDDKKIEGCCVCEPISQAYPVLSDADSQTSQNGDQRQRPWYCSDVPVPASVGVSRIWVHSQARRKRVASKLLDCVRQWSVYGSVIPKNQLAFSDPTPDGKILATKYTGTPNFLVYKFT